MKKEQTPNNVTDNSGVKIMQVNIILNQIILKLLYTTVCTINKVC
jgi:hypothetical protein